MGVHQDQEMEVCHRAWEARRKVVACHRTIRREVHRREVCSLVACRRVVFHAAASRKVAYLVVAYQTADAFEHQTEAVQSLVVVGHLEVACRKAADADRTQVVDHPCPSDQTAACRTEAAAFQMAEAL